MIIAISKGQSLGAIAWLCLASAPAIAADQVLSCAPKGADGPEVRVLISESMFSRGVILWPSQAGTVVFDIKEKSQVSYSAAQRARPEAAGPGGSVYINRLNGQLRFRAPVDPELAVTLAKLCKGRISREACADMLQGTSIGGSVCFASVDCTKLLDDGLSGIEASYDCKRSFKKF